MASMVYGLNFLLRYVPMESYIYNLEISTRQFFQNPCRKVPTPRITSKSARTRSLSASSISSPSTEFTSNPIMKISSSKNSSSESQVNIEDLSLETNPEFFPYLLVNVGSGVSILYVDGWDSYRRISGTSLGGGTFYGLCNLLTGISTFPEMLAASDSGNPKNVDLIVGDIYGDAYSAIGLKADTLASSFGKIAREKRLGPNQTQTVPTHSMTRSSDPNKTNPYSNSDICSSLLDMISYNIAQIAYLNAVQFPNITRIYFTGNFIADHEQTLKTLSFGLNFWSKGKLSAHFLVHGGFLGALGCFFTKPRMEENISSTLSS